MSLHGPATNRPARILLLEDARSRVEQSHYILRYLLQAWAEKGFQILRSSDPARLPGADMLFLHVDLSVLSPAYRDLAGRYPAAINADIVDIRKRTLGVNQVFAGDGYHGPVIVKSNLNSAGWSERKATSRQDVISQFALRLRRRGRKVWKR